LATFTEMAVMNERFAFIFFVFKNFNSV